MVCHPHDVAERRPVLYVHRDHTQNLAMLPLLLKYMLSHGIQETFHRLPLGLIDLLELVS